VDRALPMDPVPSRAQSLRFNHNGNMLVAGSADGMIRVFDISRSGAIMGWPAHGSGVGVSALAMSPDETAVFSLSSDGRVVTEWSLHRVGEAVRRWEIRDDRADDLFCSSSSVGDIAVTRTHAAVAIGGKGTVISLDGEKSSTPSTSAVVQRIAGATSVDWDEKTLLVGKSDGMVGTYAYQL